MTEQILKSAILIAVLSVVAGCATADVTNLKDYHYKAKSEDCKIEVLALEPKDRKFDAFAYVSSRGGLNAENLNELLPEMKKKACEIGADAILIQSVNPGGVQPLGEYKEGNATALAIKFL